MYTKIYKLSSIITTFNNTNDKLQNLVHYEEGYYIARVLKDETMDKA